VRIEKRDEGGRVTIDFFNKEDLRALLDRIDAERVATASVQQVVSDAPVLTDEEKIVVEDKPKAEEEDESIYSASNFSI
jgi:hypothetical protein